MSYIDPNSDTMTTGGAGVPPLVGYGADSTLNTTSGEDAIPMSAGAPGGAAGMGAPDPTASPLTFGANASADEPDAIAIEVTETQVEALDDESWNLRRTGLIAGVVVAGLAAGAAGAWLFMNSRRARRARLAATRDAQIAQARKLLKLIPAQTQASASKATPARQRVSGAADAGAAWTRQASQSARDLSASAVALAESAVASAQEALERAMVTSQLVRNQTLSASQLAQDRITDTWDRTRATASTSWDAAARTAKVARDATRHTVGVARDAAFQTADTARSESKRTARTAQAGWRRTQRAATR
jgi:hypothetical protein